MSSADGFLTSQHNPCFIYTCGDSKHKHPPSPHRKPLMDLTKNGGVWGSTKNTHAARCVILRAEGKLSAEFLEYLAVFFAGYDAALAADTPAPAPAPAPAPVPAPAPAAIAPPAAAAVEEKQEQVRVLCWVEKQMIADYAGLSPKQKELIRQGQAKAGPKGNFMSYQITKSAAQHQELLAARAELLALKAELAALKAMGAQEVAAAAEVPVVPQ